MRRTDLLSKIAFAVAVAAAIPGFAAEPETWNDVVVIVDGSGSYRARQAEALAKAQALLDGLAAEKLKRWERAPDKVTVIALDALPDVLWTGTVQSLKSIDRAAWIKRFEKRSDFASCTDVSAAFRLALRQFDGDPRYVSRYIFAFTDLVHEPPAASLRQCEAPRSPAPDFPWKQLKGVSVTVMWVPPAQVLAWRRAAVAHGVETSFAILSDSESAEVAIAPPPKSVHVMTDSERRAAQQSILADVHKWARRIGMIIGVVLALLIGLGTASAVTRRLRGSRKRSAALAPRSTRTTVGQGVSASAPTRDPRRHGSS